MRKTMKHKVRFILMMILAMCLELLIYVVLHEGGHTLVALMAGARITEFNIFVTNAHMAYEGGNFTPFLSMWIDANGALVPLLVSYIYALLYRKEIKNHFYRIFSFLICFVNAMSAMVWVLTPFLFINGYSDMSDDSFKFINKFNYYHNPLIISLVSAVLVGTGIFLVIKRGIFRSFIEVIKDVRKSVLEQEKN